MAENCRRNCLYREAPMHPKEKLNCVALKGLLGFPPSGYEISGLRAYMEPSYLIWTCCEMIAPVVGSLFGLMNT